MSTAAHSGPIREVVDDDGVAENVAVASLALSDVDRASIDMQIATAKQYPRVVSKSLKEAMDLATLDEETAASMFYSLPRGGKQLEGPSARLAEVMAYAWGNLRIDADIVAEERTTVTAQGTCFDLEKNVAIRVRVKRRITDKNGKRFNEDMIGVTQNAAISIALRNSVFKVVPRAFVDRIYAAAREASIGKAGTLSQKRQNAMAWFAKAGVKPEEVFAVLEVKDLDDVGTEELITLRGIMSAIKDGQATVETVFRPTDKSEGTQDLNAALKNTTSAATTGAKPSGAKKPEPAAAAKSTPADPNTCSECGKRDGNHTEDCSYAE